MSEKVKPCPFCGGEAEVVWELNGFATVECICCGALVDGIERWNTRAGRTCRNVDNYRAIGDFTCSECGDHWRDFIPGAFNYCPNCGAKVVE